MCPGDAISQWMDQLCDHLTILAVMDVSDDLRFELLSKMCRREELHLRLAQDTTIRRLSSGLYDTSLSIRQACVQLMGRLAVYNFTAVMPLMRELLLKVMEDFKFEGDTAITSAILSDAAQLLRTLLTDHAEVTGPVNHEIMESLLHRLEVYTTQKTAHRSVKDPAAKSVCSLLVCLKEHVRGSSQSLVKLNVPRMAVILTALIKESNDEEEQLMAIQLISQICDVTGDSLLQHLRITELMACVTELRKEPKNASIIDHVIQSLTERDSVFQSLISQADVTSETEDLLSLNEIPFFPTDESTVGDEAFYSSAAIHVSLAVLEDARNTDYESIVKGLMCIFGRLQKSGVFYLQRVIPVLAKIIREADDKLRLVLFQHLSDLVRIAGPDVRPYCSALMDLCSHFWSGPSAQTVHILNLMAELARAVQSSFATFLKDLIPRLSDVLSNPKDFQLVEPTLGLLQACDAELGTFFPVLFPIVLQFLQRVPIYEEPIPLNIQREVLRTLRYILAAVNFREEQKYLMASKLNMTLIELLRQEESLRSDIEDTLTVILSVLGPKISHIFARQINRV